MDKKWIEDNFFDIAFFCIVVSILVWAFIVNNGTIIDKILLVALGMFKGVSIATKKE